MADTKLSDLSALGVEPADTDEFYINDGGTSKKIAWSTIKSFFATSAQGTTADSALQDVVDDASPTLGGNLDADSNDITNIGALAAATLALTALLTRSVAAGLTADAGSAQGGTPLTKDINEISTCGTTGDSVTLPTAAAGLTVTIINNGANAADVFPASGDDLGAGVDTAASLAAGANITYAAYDATNWVAVT